MSGLILFISLIVFTAVLGVSAIIFFRVLDSLSHDREKVIEGNDNHTESEANDTYYKDLLDRANNTIRAANKRISLLKLEVKKGEGVIESLELSNKNLEAEVEDMSLFIAALLSKIDEIQVLSDLSDLDIMGFEDCPNSQILRKRYKTLASLYHPDKGGSHKMMSRLNDAYSRLK